jgi:hypothetical protein
VRNLYDRLPLCRMAWMRLGNASSPGFCIHLDREFYPTLSCVLDSYPMGMRPLRGLELYVILDPSGERSSVLRAFPKSLSSAQAEMDRLISLAREFVANQAKLVPGARVIIDGAEEVVRRVYRDLDKPQKYKHQVAIVGSRRRYAFSQVLPMEEISRG